LTAKLSKNTANKNIREKYFSFSLLSLAHVKKKISIHKNFRAKITITPIQFFMSTFCMKGCQMVCFQTKNTKLRRAFEW
jgi:hypothetical protein